jgi:hypothetical protein
MDKNLDNQIITMVISDSDKIMAQIKQAVNELFYPIFWANTKNSQIGTRNRLYTMK